MKVIFFCLIQFVLAVIVSYSIANYSEWVCHRNPLEEILLERIIRIELRMEQIEKELQKTQNDISNFIEDQNQDLEEFSNNYNILRESVQVPLVAFHSYGPNSASLKVNQIIIFKTSLLNEGNGYDPETGLFTAPVRGLYQFNAHICNHEGSVIVYAIVRGDETLALSVQWDKLTISTCNSVNALAVVNAGQRVSVRAVLMSGSMHIFENVHRRNTFNGVLLHK